MKNLKTEKLLLPGIWYNYFIPINNKLLSKVLIDDSVIKFWNEVILDNIDQYYCNYYILLLFRIQFSDGKYINISNLQKLNIYLITTIFLQPLQWFNIYAFGRFSPKMRKLFI